MITKHLQKHFLKIFFNSLPVHTKNLTNQIVSGAKNAELHFKIRRLLQRNDPVSDGSFARRKGLQHLYHNKPNLSESYYILAHREISWKITSWTGPVLFLVTGKVLGVIFLEIYRRDTENSSRPNTELLLNDRHCTAKIQVFHIIFGIILCEITGSSKLRGLGRCKSW